MRSKSAANFRRAGFANIYPGCVEPRRRWRQVCLLGFLSVLAPLSGCGGTIGEVRITIDLEMEVASASTHRPIPGLEILLYDLRRVRGLSKAQQQRYVCTTDARGACRAVVKYGYCESRWPWDRFTRPSPGLGQQFEVLTHSGEQLVSLGFLPIKDASEVQGRRKVVYRARL